MSKKLIPVLLTAFAALVGNAEENIEYNAYFEAQASSKGLAPYMMGSWNSGRFVQGKGAWQGASAIRPLDTDKRFSWSYGLEYVAGYGTEMEYDRFDAGNWTKQSFRPSSLRLIQLFGQIKYRSVYLLAGMKERSSRIVDGTLSSGDLVRSNNARPIPGISAGFLDFVDIPFTNGWLQIDGEIMYGRFTDNGYRESQFNHFQGILTRDLYYTYKRCYFRTRPTERLSVTFGMQAAGEFGGSTVRYNRGNITVREDRGFHFSDVWDMFFPKEGSGEGYYKGSSLGSWDFKARYNFNNGSRLEFYFEGPWEDGSSIGRRNGWDGLWGLEYNFANGDIVDAVVLEYLDFTNQSGPIHRTPGDTPGTTLTTETNGGDNYFNNDFYGAYANYGMAIGSPFLVAPIYNLDGDATFAHNRARGFHAAARGHIGSDIRWRAMVGYSLAGGSGRLPAAHKLHCTSAMLEAKWTPVSSIPGLELKAQAALDAGNLRGNNFGACVGISYSGNFSFGK